MMPFVRPVLLLAILLLPIAAVAQEKRPLDHDAYQRWRSISDQRLSDDGRWATWREAPDTVGDSELIVRRVGGNEQHVIARGDHPRFTAGGGWLVALIRPPYDSTRAAKVAGRKEECLPRDSLAILHVESGERTNMAAVLSFQVPDDEGDVLAVLFARDAADLTDSDCDGEPEKIEDSSHHKRNGTRLHLRRLSTGEEWSFDNATEYALTDDGAWLVYAAESEDGRADGAFAVNTANGERVAMKAGEGHYRQLVVDDRGNLSAFVTDADAFSDEQPAFSLYRAELGNAATAVAREGVPGIPDGWWVSEHHRPDFSDSGERLYFGTAPRPPKEMDDDRPDDEKVQVDIWSWTDPILQPTQLLEKDRELRRAYAAVLHRDGRVVQLGTESIPDIEVLESGDAPVVIGSSNLPYRKEISWDTPGYTDYYVIDVETGASRRLLEGIRSQADASPDGSHLAWWNPAQRAWMITSTASGRTVDITSATNVRFDNEEHDWPRLPDAYGAAGWSRDGGAFLLYDDFDLWIATADGGMLASMTDGTGRRDRIRYRYVELDPDAKGIDLQQPLFLSAFSETTKASGFATLERGTEGPQSLIMEDASIQFRGKAKNADRIVFTRESFVEFGDLWSADLAFDDCQRLSDSNPQQAEYLWGTAELVRWVSVDGDQIEGLLYKPEGFDPSTKYPLMVYFYEKNADGLHRYHPANPHRSVVRPSFYVSRGYVFFVPDIPYKVGYPGESAMNAVMPGVTRLIEQGFIDPERVGVQGHSWGGYQIAYMVTRTNLFAAAAGGAPVSNMTSAYGGIRWESGMSRMFQYEKDQSRIGGSLWEKPLRYIENSPIFWADKVETPLLIMHNDHDGAVPWYQGIELFTALRRLDRPAWLVNYNDEPHWPLPYWKRVDWNVRMQQFFDHFLKDAPAPIWMVKGIPAVRKGKTLGLELVGEQ